MKRIQAIIISASLYLFLFSFLFLAGCDQNRVEFETIITPKITLVNGDVAVQYQLGDLLILDEWSNLNAGQKYFLLENKELDVHLAVSYGDFNSQNNFIYTIGNIEVTTSPVEWKIFIRHVDSYPNVTWKVKDGKTITHPEAKEEKEVKLDETKKL